MRDSVQMPTPQSGKGIPSWSMLQSSPGPFVQGGDGLRLRATTTEATGTLTCAYRLLTKANQEIVTGSFDMIFSGTGVQTAVANPVAEGWIVGLWVGITSGTITDGEVQAAVDVMQNVGSTAFPVMSLCSGEVTNVRSLGAGGYSAGATTQNVAFADILSDNIPGPAAGANAVITVPAGETWTMYQVEWIFTTSAVVANRHCFAEFFGILGGFIDFYSPAVMPATTTRFFILGRDVTAFAEVGSRQLFGFPSGYYLTEGSSITISANNMDVGDQFSSINYMYRLV